MALKTAAKNRTYNLDGCEKVTILQIAESIKSILGDVQIQHIPARPDDFAGKDVSNERATKELEWQPRVSFEEGLRRYIEWFKEREVAQTKKWDAVDEMLKD